MLSIFWLPFLGSDSVRLIITRVYDIGLVSELKIVIKTASFLKWGTKDSSFLIVKGSYVLLCQLQDLKVWLLKSYNYGTELRP